MDTIESVASALDRTTVLVGLASTLLVTWLVKWRTRHRGLTLPPGPMYIPWPIHYVVEMIASMNKMNPVVMLDALHERYGDIFTIEQGYRHLVFLGSLEAVQDAMVKQASVTSGREELFEFTAVLKYRGGVIFSEGEEWLAHRKFSLGALRHFGMGKKVMEESIMEEAQLLRGAIGEQVGQSLNPFFLFMNAVSNIVCAITFGHRFEYSDPKFKDIVSLLNKFVAENPGALSDLPSFIINDHRRALLDLRRHLEDEVKEHERTFDCESENDARDIIDMYLFEGKRAEKAAIATKLAVDKTWTLAFDFFLAGTETTATTILWALLFIAGHPEIQEKIVAEINSVVGSARAPQIADRKSMPYTEATLAETLRSRPITPFGIPHRATENLKVGGYDLPRGIVVAANIFRIQHDPKIWGDPEVFRPERFLSEDGKTVINHEALLTFGVGRRACLGENLARMEMFLFLTTTLQHFKVTFPPGIEPDYSFGHRVTTLSPKSFNLIFNER